MKNITLLILLLFTMVLLGCSARGKKASSIGNSPYTTPAASTRSPLTAERLTLKAADLIDTDPEQAEHLLREALATDLHHGPAHNNLGVVFLNRGMLYEAANEFEWARKLMPGHPDPRLNLALTLERAGRIDDALETYAAALEVYPNHLPAVQALTRCQLRHSRTDDSTKEHLQEIALCGETEQWRTWAQRQIVQ